MAEIPPQRIYSEFEAKKLEKTKAVELLASMLKNYHKIDEYISIINYLLKIDSKSLQVYNILKSILISEFRETIRKTVLILIIKNYFKVVYLLLEDSIQEDNSASILKELYTKTTTSSKTSIISLKSKLHSLLGEMYGVVIEEIPFFLDLELLRRVKGKRNLIKTSLMNVIKLRETEGPPYAVRHGHVRALDLTCEELEKIPTSIGLLTRLTYLKLSSNNLTNLPDTIGDLCFLKELDLAANKFISLPDSLEKLKYLKKLDLSYNFHLKEVPTLLYRISNNIFSQKYIEKGVNSAEAIVLGIFEILIGKELVDFGQKKDHDYISGKYKIDENGHIIELNLIPHEDFCLGLFPEPICSLKFLEILELGYNSIKKIPNSIDRLESLKDLHLTSNKVEYIPNSIGNLKNLESLTLQGNNVKYIPETIGQLKSLKCLILSENKIKIIPETIGKLNSLEYLILNDNKIKTLPKSIRDLKSLKTMYIYKNPIDKST